MHILEEGWTRLKYDTDVYDVTGKLIETIRATYGINILEIGQDFVRVFSPDLNKNVYIKIKDLERE